MNKYRFILANRLETKINGEKMIKLQFYASRLEKERLANLGWVKIQLFYTPQQLAEAEREAGYTYQVNKEYSLCLGIATELDRHSKENI